MYDAYAYYADQYGFVIAAGVHYPPEPWGLFMSIPTRTLLISVSTSTAIPTGGNATTEL